MTVCGGDEPIATQTLGAAATATRPARLSLQIAQRLLNRTLMRGKKRG